ncbi:hypothetical protein OS125_11645, partial [Corynebacterium sp. P7003]
MKNDNFCSGLPGGGSLIPHQMRWVVARVVALICAVLLAMSVISVMVTGVADADTPPVAYPAPAAGGVTPLGGDIAVSAAPADDEGVETPDAEEGVETPDAEETVLDTEGYEYGVVPDLVRKTTGTGHGTSSRCPLNSSAQIPFEGGDDTAEDDVVCTNDWVRYNIQLAVKTKPVDPEDFTVILDLWSFDIPGIDQSFGQAGNREINTSKGEGRHNREYHQIVTVSEKFSTFCQARAREWDKAVPKIVKVNGKYVPACTFTPSAGLDVVYGQDISVLADDRNTTLDEARVYVVRGDLEKQYPLQSSVINGYTANYSEIDDVVPTVARGYEVVGVADADFYVEQSESDARYPVSVDGKKYIKRSLNLRAAAPVRDEAADFTEKGSLFLSLPGDTQTVPLTLENAPEGSFITADPTGAEIKEVTLNNIDEPVNLGINGDYGRKQLSPFYMFLPADAVNGGFNDTFSYRIKEDLPSFTAVAGDLVNGGRTEIGSGEPCDFDTSQIGGYKRFRPNPSDDQMPKNNNCGISEPYVFVVGNILSKTLSLNGPTYSEIAFNDMGYSDVTTLNQVVGAVISVDSSPEDRKVEVCDTWNPEEQNLTILPGLDLPYRIYSPGPGTENLPSEENMTAYYSAEEKENHGCGLAGSLEGWYTDPAKVPGGINNVRAFKLVADRPVSLVNGFSVRLDFLASPDLENRDDFDERGRSPKIWDYAYVSVDEGDSFLGPVSDYYRYMRPFVFGRIDTDFQVFDSTPGSKFEYELRPFLVGMGFSKDHPVSTTGSVELDACLDVEDSFVTRQRGFNPSDLDGTKSRTNVNVIRSEDTGDIGCSDDEPTIVEWSIPEDSPLPLSEVNSLVLVVEGRVSHLITADEVRTDAKLTWQYLDSQGVVQQRSPYGRYKPVKTDIRPIYYQIGLAASMEVSDTLILLEDPVSWTVGLHNTFDHPVSDVRWIDVLPYDGDDQGTRTSGKVTLSEVESSPGMTLEYTSTPPADISREPDDSTNAPGGSTKWCADLGSGEDDCPGSLDEVTAVRMSGDFEPGELEAVKMTASVPGAVDGDVLFNRLSLGQAADEGQLRAGVPSPDPLETVLRLPKPDGLGYSRIEGLVYFDKDNDFSKGPNDEAYPDITVSLIDREASANSDDDEDLVIATKKTDEYGKYSFDDLLPGTYAVKIDVPADMKVRQSGPDRSNQGHANVEKLVVPRGKVVTIEGIDFGLIVPPILGVSKYVNGDDSAKLGLGEVASFDIFIDNYDLDVTNVRLTDNWNGGDYDLSCDVMSGDGEIPLPVEVRGDPLSGDGAFLKAGESYYCRGEYVVTEADIAGGGPLINEATVSAKVDGEDIDEV